MASDQDKPKPAGGPASGGRKRPVEPRPIELQATEVPQEGARDHPDQAPQARPEDDAAAAAAAGEASQPSSPEGESPPTAASERAAAEIAEPQAEPSIDDGVVQQTERAAPPEPGRQRVGAAALIGAGLAGGLAAVLLMVAVVLAELWTPAQDTALREDLAAAQARIQALEEAEVELPPAADLAELEGLAARVAELEEAVARAASQEDLATLAERLSGLEAAPAEAPALPEDAEARLAEIEERIAELGEAVSAAAEEAASDGPVADRLSQIEAAVSEEQDARQGLADRMGRLEAMLAEAEAAIDRRTARAAAGAVALAGLSRAVEAGQPYARELAILGPLIDDPQAIETLSDHSEAGLATTRELRDTFDARAAAILNAGDDPGAAGDVLTRVTSGLQSLVRVRPAGPVEGDSRAAVISRIEAALAEGELAAAHAEWRNLDAQAREVSSDWAGALAARLAAEDELAAISTETMAALGALLDDPE